LPFGWRSGPHLNPSNGPTITMLDACPFISSPWITVQSSLQPASKRLAKVLKPHRQTIHRCKS
jgi:hypothetical protein